MLRKAQHERKFIKKIKDTSVRPFDKLRTGSQRVEGRTESFSNPLGPTDRKACVDYPTASSRPCAAINPLARETPQSYLPGATDRRADKFARHVEASALLYYLIRLDQNALRYYKANLLGSLKVNENLEF